MLKSEVSNIQNKRWTLFPAQTPAVTAHSVLLQAQGRSILRSSESPMCYPRGGKRRETGKHGGWGRRGMWSTTGGERLWPQLPIQLPSHTVNEKYSGGEGEKEAASPPPNRLPYPVKFSGIWGWVEGRDLIGYVGNGGGVRVAATL